MLLLIGIAGLSMQVHSNAPKVPENPYTQIEMTAKKEQKDEEEESKDTYKLK